MICSLLGKLGNSTLEHLCQNLIVLLLPWNSIGWYSIPSFPSVFLFRDWVSPNLPVIIRGGAAHFPALKNWSPELLRSRIGNASVTVAVTPNGLADAPQGDQFVMPEERTMKMEEFLDIIENPEWCLLHPKAKQQPY